MISCLEPRRLPKRLSIEQKLHMQDLSAAWWPGPKVRGSKVKESKRKVRENVIDKKNKDQIIFLLSVFPKESTFSIKSLMSLFIFYILDVFGQKKKRVREEERNDKKLT